ncbi:MAG: stimulus-sensing domain-containing protein [Bdellovibrionales bacterium]
MSFLHEIIRRICFIFSKQPEACPWPPLPWALPRVHRRISPLTLRIMIVNMIALAILGASLLYLGHYKDQLIDAELNALQMQARMSSNALTQGAVVLDFNERNILSPLLARLMIRRLAEVSEARTRLFDSENRVIADSSVLLNRGEWRNFERQNSDSWFLKNAMNILNVFEGFQKRRAYELYQEKKEQQSQDLELLDMARAGSLVSRIWQRPKGGILLSVAVPVQRYHQVLGVLVLSRPDNNIEQAMYEVRTNILTLIGVALLVTVLLSLYLARAISRPLKKLSQAAETVRLGQAQNVGLSGSARLLESHIIPDFSSRQDEIGDLSVALREMTMALARRLGAIENFAADVAHEIKNPLTSLRSAVETAFVVKDPVRQEKLMRVILDDVNRLDRLISDISNASRLDAELTRDEARSLDVYKMLQTAVDFYLQRDGAGVRLSLLSEQNVHIAGVEERLFQVLRNLIDNALSFTAKDAPVIVMVRHVHDVAEITVEDSGPGIPEDKEDRIFTRFYSERPKQEKFGTHSGLGLSISRQIVEAHQGKIWAENRKDDDGQILGARFVIQLPVLGDGSK